MASLARPGVEVIQKFASTSPTIVTPTLVPMVIAPFFEIIEATKKDGTVNSKAKLSTNYEQTALKISQTSFPSPRANISEVDVTESKIRAFFNFGGALSEVKRTQGFLISYKAMGTIAAVTGTGTAVFNLAGRNLVIALDAHTAVGTALPSSVPSSADVTIAFTADAMTLQAVVDAINAVVPSLASLSGGNLKLTSAKKGAGSSVCVRNAGTAGQTGAGLLGFTSGGKDKIAVGAGFYADDDADGDTTSPRLRIFTGTTQRDIDAANVAVVTAPNFVTDEVKVGDELVVDGVNVGEVDQVDASLLLMKVEQNLMTSSKKFAPGNAWVKGNGLSFPAPASSTKGSLTATVQTSAATKAYITSQADPSFVATIPVSESFTIAVTKAGIAQTPVVVVPGSGGWASLAAAITNINAQSTTNSWPFEAYRSNQFGDEISANVPAGTNVRLGLRTKTDNTGSQGSISYTAQSPGMTLGFTPTVSDAGENQRYLLGTKPSLVRTSAWAAPAGTVTVTVTVNHRTAPTTDIVESISVTTAETTLALAITKWNDQAKYTVASDDGTGKLKVTTLGENFGTSAKLTLTTGNGIFGALADATVVAGTNSGINDKTFKWSVDLNARVYSVTFATDEDDAGVSFQQVLDKVNQLTASVAATDGSSPAKLKITSQIAGGPAQIKVLDGTANAGLGFSDNAENLGKGRPAADLGIDSVGAANLQAQVLRDARTGDPFQTASAQVYIAYHGLRLDVTAAAKEPGVLSIKDTVTLEKVADPVSTDNPGALMTYLALLNASNLSVSALGVDEVSDDLPDGTPKGYSKAFSFLETREAYALAPASQDPNVHAIGAAHVTAMSKPENKGERIVFIAPKTPTRAVSALVGSGTDANSTGVDNEVTVELNIAPKLIELGIDPTIDINPTTGALLNEVYLDLSGTALDYLIQKVTNGTKLTLRTSFAGTENADKFYASATLKTAVISDDWAVKVRGKKLLIPGSTLPDNDAIAEAVQKTAAAFLNRRVFMVFPDTVGVNVTGVEQKVPSYYAAAAAVGMVAQQPPQQGFTNFPITGLTRAIGSHDKFTEGQLSVMAAGGVYILIQDAQTAPVICRHQLSTDLTSIETRELSITKDVDYVAKFIRAALRNFIGRSNITQAFLDQLSAVVEGCLSFLREAGVIIGGQLNNLIQDASAPDTVICDLGIDPPYPCNVIRVTVIV